MSEEKVSSREGSNSTATVVIVVALPLLYALSIGPAALYMTLHHGSQALEGAAVKFFQPILWLHDHTALKQPIEAYMDWWRSLA